MLKDVTEGKAAAEDIGDGRGDDQVGAGQLPPAFGDGSAFGKAAPHEVPEFVEGGVREVIDHLRQGRPEPIGGIGRSGRRIHGRKVHPEGKTEEYRVLSKAGFGLAADG